MYSIKYTKQFKRDYKLCKKRGLEMALLILLDFLQQKAVCHKSIIHAN